MKINPLIVTRRRFLRGAGGVAVGLPLLDVLQPKPVRGAVPAKPVYAAFLTNMNGVQQAGFGAEPERFWPTALGALTKASLAADSGRATSELAEHAERLLMVRGVKLPFLSNGCAHSGAGNQLLTAAKVSDIPDKNKSLAMGESVDNYIARQLGVEPLALYAGPKDGYINDHISFRGAKDLRVAENNPYLAYTKIVGAGGATTGDAAAKLASRRLSVNDLIRTETNELLARTDLSALDRQRLEMHRDVIRDIETKITLTLPPEEIGALKGINGQHRQGANRQKVDELQMDLMAFSLASGYTQVAFLQSGDGSDAVEYTVDGKLYPRFHLVSHRAATDGAIGDGTMPDAVNQHHQIDRIKMRQFKYFLDKLASYSTPEGSLLDIGYAVWMNQVGTGNHNFHNIPYLIAGKARGFFKTGQYFSASGSLDSSPKNNVNNNKLLNTFINAFGLRKAGGAPVDDFGDVSLETGALSQISNG